MRNQKHLIGIVLGASLMLLSISHWFPLGNNLLELFGAFAHFTFVVSVLFVLVAMVLRQWIPTALSLSSASLCAVLVVPHFSTFIAHEKDDFTIGQFNLYHNNASPELAISELEKLNADVFTIQELNSAWKPIIDSVFLEEYPYRIEEPWNNCCYGIGLYSKFPIAHGSIFKTESTPAIKATINIGGKVVRVVSFHTKPPVFPNETEERNQQMRTVAKIASEITGPLIVLGDLNIVPWDSEFKSFLKAGNLKAVRDGFQATYPMYFGVPLIPIDHITYSNGLIPTSCEVIKILGSDHKGMVATFKLE